mmetsp:Transcript_8138/g.16283  ORF Transcript_8138/g.16283 Transcript_8138/m.16283 type:complete len:95 (-) Transcript_8138:82-366(-)
MAKVRIFATSQSFQGEGGEITHSFATYYYYYYEYVLTGLSCSPRSAASVATFGSDSARSRMSSSSLTPASEALGRLFGGLFDATMPPPTFAANS